MSFYKNNLYPKAIFIMGPTASGKTNLAINLIKYIPSEIISVDSALIYKEMNIGTNKPDLKTLFEHNHYLINIKEPFESYSSINFCLDAINKMKQITKLGKIPLLVGGSILYFKMLIEGFPILPYPDIKIRYLIKKKKQKIGNIGLYNILYKIDKDTAKKIHFNDFKRISRALEINFITNKKLKYLINKKFNKLKYKIYIFSIFPTNIELIYNKVYTRCNNMLNNGFEDEVKHLINIKKVNQKMVSMKCIGYKQMYEYILGKIKYENMIINIIRANKNFIKKQINWIKKINNINYINGINVQNDIKNILNIINK
ncbi:MAG: tRNA (adenosine(37)-N6)-dimethylallyltransferase MiaA [Candidatus Makana argininalis]